LRVLGKMIAYRRRQSGIEIVGHRVSGKGRVSTIGIDVQPD
jgi:hypothetical protein